MEIFNNECYVLLFFCFIYFVNCQTSPEQCFTPNSQEGTCISIKNCKYLSDQYQHVPKPLNTDQINNLHNYHCGFDGSIPKVCCPQEAPPSLLNRHHNLHLINQNNCGGKVESLSQFPWMALIAYTGDNGKQFRCSGTLINENYILTAAQCITNLKTYSLSGVRLGEYDLQTEIDCYHPKKCAPKYQDIEIAEIIPHEEYNPSTMQNDIGLLKLKLPANIQTETIKPICLHISENTSENLIGKEGIITGWGATDSGYASSQLLKTSIPILDNKICETKYKLQNTKIKISDHQICAGGVKGKDSCSGDGGGPLGFKNNEGIFEQYGIISFGSRFCGIDKDLIPGVYTRVDKYIKWILDNIRN